MSPSVLVCVCVSVFVRCIINKLLQTRGLCVCLARHSVEAFYLFLLYRKGDMDAKHSVFLLHFCVFS